MTNAVPASSLQQKTGSILRRVANGEHLVIEHRGIPIAVMMPLVEYKRMTQTQPAERSAPSSSTFQPTV